MPWSCVLDERLCRSACPVTAAVAERLVDLARDPQAVQQHGEFASDGGLGSLASVLAAAFGQFQPHLLRSLSFPKGPMMWFALLTSRRRRNGSPAFVIRSCGSELPDWSFRGRSPRNAPATRLVANRFLSSIVRRYARAVKTPTPCG
jgi:hypothetical protein